MPLAFGCARQADCAEEPPGAAEKSKAKAEGKQHPANHLAGETSPYLLMHAHNPVDWYPWGEEALKKAKREGKLIFLSIGYSSCYWCHVMERESFMNEKIAEYLNEHFVAIKVDREERPDIDEIYMTSLHALGQQGGWPLSMFLTPDARPLVGGTYFPPEEKRGLPGFLDVLERVHDQWENNRDKLEQQADLLTSFVKRQLRPQFQFLDKELKPGQIDEVFSDLAEQYDPKYGGFGYRENEPRVPKFPRPNTLLLLLDRARRHDDARALGMLTTTLDHMARGGIRDHLGGGFHRYSTDRYWRVPHFEKMLYDNGQLASVYAEAYALTERPLYARVARGIADFVLREMTDEGGGFYAALDAETEAEEGAYYVWTKERLGELLTPEELSLVSDVYGVSGEPSFEDDRYVLHMPQPLAEVAERYDATPEKLLARLEPVKKKLLAARGERERPLTDIKILTGWNGLMIRGLADLGRILDEPRYTAAAARAADFLLANVRTPDGRLRHTYTSGEASLNAYVDDYAFLIDGLIALDRATDDPRWLRVAEELIEQQIEHYWDEKNGAFYFTSGDHEALIARSKDPADSATPSGNAVSVGNLVYLAEALDKPEYLRRAENTVTPFLAYFERSPASLGRMAHSLSRLLAARPEKPDPEKSDKEDDDGGDN